MGEDSSHMMRAVVTDPLAPGRLRLVMAPRPEPGPAEALVRVLAVSLNRGEVKVALNAPGGWRPGSDFVGVVERAAANGSGPAEGSRVVGIASAGAWADYLVARGRSMARVPEGVSTEDAAVLPVAGLTARAALARSGDLTGRRVLVTGATGGVGVLAIQLAARLGAEVTAAVRRQENVALMMKVGAQAVAVGPDLAIAAKGQTFDLIVESVSGDTLGAALELLARGGTCVLLGAASGAPTTFDSTRFRAGGTSLYGLVMRYEFRKEAPSIGLVDLLEMLDSGALKAVIERRAPIADVATVANDLYERRFAGKAVLSM